VTAIGRLDPLELRRFRAVATHGPTLALSGRITPQDPTERLTPYFRSVHDAAIADGAAHVRVDLTGLDFMSSSAIRALTSWIVWLRDEPEARRYRLVFVRRPDADWLQLTLGALETIGAGSVVLETADGSDRSLGATRV
jgi:hypothetical protein